MSMSYLRRPQKLSKSSPSIWHYLVSVKSTVNISSILENTNFKNSSRFHWPWNIQNQGGTFISHHGKLIKGKNEKVDLVLSNMKIWLELWEKDLAESNKHSNMNYIPIYAKCAWSFILWIFRKEWVIDQSFFCCGPYIFSWQDKHLKEVLLKTNGMHYWDLTTQPNEPEKF